MIYDQDIDWTGFRFQLKPELLLQGFQKRCACWASLDVLTGCRGSIGRGRPLDDVVKIPAESGLIQDGATHLCYRTQKSSDSFHGHISRTKVNVPGFAIPY